MNCIQYRDLNIYTQRNYEHGIICHTIQTPIALRFILVCKCVL